MRVILQRVSRAEVGVGGEVVGVIGPGHLLLVGFRTGDGFSQIEWMTKKILGLRVFLDDDGKMNRSVEEVRGDVLVVRQFTLYGDVIRGRRPSFMQAAEPDTAKTLYETFVTTLRERTDRKIETVCFGAMMEVDHVNDGPVTLLLERE